MNLETANLSLVLSKDGMFSTIQGEGPRIGRPTTFMRLGGCNLKCSWCDTPYTWDWNKYDARVEMVPTPIREITDYIISKHISSLTITGGEPFLQARGLQKLFRLFADLKYPFEDINFETNGTIYPEWGPEVWGISQAWGIVISPKLANSGNSVLEGDILRKVEALIRWLVIEERLDGEANRPWMEVDFKFVCQSENEFHEIEHLRDLVTASDFPMLARHIWIMPEGTEPNLITVRARRMVDEVIARGWNLTPRWHQDLWGNKRAK